MRRYQNKRSKQFYQQATFSLFNYYQASNGTGREIKIMNIYTRKQGFEGHALDVQTNHIVIRKRLTMEIRSRCLQPYISI